MKKIEQLLARWFDISILQDYYVRNLNTLVAFVKFFKIVKSLRLVSRILSKVLVAQQ